MAEFNLERLSVKELKEFVEKAQSLITKKGKEERDALLKKFKNEAAQKGFDFNELVGGEGTGRGRGRGKRQLKPKFRHPENPDVTWSGVGRKPKWVAEAEKEGKLEQLRIRE